MCIPSAGYSTCLCSCKCRSYLFVDKSRQLGLSHVHPSRHDLHSKSRISENGSRVVR
ncbi:hypothetical protein HanIR_Chr09g0406181 [Helianthus annuus]|nr:hypothetical protein HanIR_Chr09g0406181 [Helianthus annuus]